MARVTIEDCTKFIPSRFELVVLAAQRAKEISSGAPIVVDRENDKNPVIALREVAAGLLTPEGLKEALIKRFQKKHSIEDKNSQVDDDMHHSDIAEEMNIFSAVYDEEEGEESFEEGEEAGITDEEAEGL